MIDTQETPLRVFVVGLDGASLRLIRPWVEQGHLPGFARIIAEGAWGKLESVPNQRSAAAWTTFMTGKNPGKHGIYEFYEFVPHTYAIRFIHGGMRDGATLWGLVGQAGRKVGVINVPMTYPAEQVNGFLIAGLDAPGVESKGFCYPPDLYKRLVREIGGYTIEPGLTGCIVGGDIDMAVRRLHEELDQKIAATRFLMTHEPWDLFVSVFRSTDAAHHCFWKYMDEQHPAYRPEDAHVYGDVILSAYRKLDTFLVELMDHLLDDRTVLLIMSDHGCGPKHPASNQLNQWLEANKYLAYSSGTSSGETGVVSRLLGSLYTLVIGKTPRRLKENLWRWFPQLRNRVQSRLCFAGIDWKRTRVFSDTLFPILRINLKGREPQGIVEPGNEYWALVEELKESLSHLRDRTSGLPIVDRVFHRDEIYTGPYVDKAPDLLVRWREDIPISGIMIDSSSSTSEPIVTPLIPGEDFRVISGDHNLNGIIMAWGSIVAPGIEIQGATLADLAPTILYAMSLPVPDDMDGQELLGLFTEEFVVRHPRTRKTASSYKDQGSRDQGYSEQDEETMRERLRGLGYVE